MRAACITVTQERGTVSCLVFTCAGWQSQSQPYAPGKAQESMPDEDNKGLCYDTANVIIAVCRELLRILDRCPCRVEVSIQWNPSIKKTRRKSERTAKVQR